MKKVSLIIVSLVSFMALLASCSAPNGSVNYSSDKLPGRESGFSIINKSDERVDMKYKNPLGSYNIVSIKSEYDFGDDDESASTVFSGKLNCIDLSEFTSLEKMTIVSMLNTLMSSYSSTEYLEGLDYKYIEDDNSLALRIKIDKDISELSKQEMVKYSKFIGDVVAYVDAYMEQYLKDAGNDDYEL